jgi:Fe(3+) dicitrate transport protein
VPRLTLLGAIVAATVAISAPAAAQQAAVSGTVRADRAASPLAGVAVTLEGTALARSTDTLGHYRFGPVPPGTYVLRFARLGFATLTRSVVLAVGDDRVLDVTLVASAVPLRPMTVIEERTSLTGGAPRDVPGSAHRLARDALDASIAPFADIHAVLRQVPGINIQEEDGYGLRPNIGMRGAGSDRSSKVTLMEDGVLIAPAPYAASAAYYFPTTGRMDAVEVRKGSSQIKHGPRTIGGAINLVSAGLPDRLTARADLSGGTDDTRRFRAEVGDAYRNLAWVAQTHQITTDGFKRLDGGGPTGFDVSDYLLKLRVNTNPGAPLYQELELKTAFTTHHSDETYLGLTESDFRADPVRRYAASRLDAMNTDHRLLTARHFVRPSAALDLTTTVYRTDFTRAWYKLQSVNGLGLAGVLDDPAAQPDAIAVLRGGDSDPGALVVRNNNRDYYAQGIQSVAAVRFDAAGARHQTEVGVRYHRDQEDRFQQDDAFQMLNGTMVSTSAGAPGSQENRVGDARAWAFFAQHRVEVGPLTLTPGVRHESVDFTRTDYERGDATRATPAGVRENAVSAWIPGLGAALRVTPVVDLFGGVHKGFDPPGPGAAPEARVEESRNYELGSRLGRGAVRAEVVGFFSDYRNVLGRATLAVGETGAGDEFNGGAVDVYGVEVMAQADPLVGRAGPFALPVSATYTFTRASFQSSFESEFEPWGDVTAGDHLPYVPSHQLYATVGLRHPTWSGALAVQASSAMRTVAGTGAIPATEGTDGYVVVGVQGEYRLAPWSTLTVAVQNLTDERYVVARRPAGARPGLPRTIVAGVRLNR